MPGALDGVTRGVDAYDDDRHITGVIAKKLVRLAQVGRDRRADIRAAGIEEGEEEHSSVVVGESSGPAALVDEVEFGRGLARSKLGAPKSNVLGAGDGGDDRQAQGQEHPPS